MFPKIEGSKCRLKLIRVRSNNGEGCHFYELAKKDTEGTSKSSLEVTEIVPQQNRLIIRDNQSNRGRCRCDHPREEKLSDRRMMKKSALDCETSRILANPFHRCRSKKNHKERKISVVSVDDDQYGQIRLKPEKTNHGKWVNSIIKRIFADKRQCEEEKQSRMVEINGKCYEIIDEQHHKGNAAMMEKKKQRVAVDYEDPEEWQVKANQQVRLRQHLNSEVSEYIKCETVFHLQQKGKYRGFGKMNKVQTEEKLNLCQQKCASEEQKNSSLLFSNTDVDKQLKKNLLNYYNEASEVKEAYVIKFPTLESVDETILKYESLTGLIDTKVLMKSKEYYREFSDERGKEFLYFGGWDLAKKQKRGCGVYVTKNVILEGVWSGNQISNGAELRIHSIYKGSFVNNRKHGEGECKWLNGEQYLGEWKNGLRHGHGCWCSKHGTQTYSGEWQQGRVTGYGEYFMKNCSVYKGFFQNFVKTGTGTEVFVNGDRYEGAYVNGEPNGKGTYIWECGLVFKGQFSNGQRQGRGELTKEEVFQIQGRFSREKPHGICRLKLINGDVFNGKFVYGVKYGFGTMQYFGSHREQTGFWYNDELKERVSSENIIYRSRSSCE